MSPSSSPSPETLDALAARDFLRAAVVEDIRQGRYGGRVVTRFPPEPNGYLHIGHAKAIVVDFGVARDFGGRCHLRMDDTNPSTESMEYVEAIQRDVAWLGFDWGEHLYFASDMYEDMYRLALRLIDKGLAYVDEQSEEEIRLHRGTVTEPGVPSPWRDRPAAESRDLFERMRAGEFPDGSMVLRARIDMAAANMLLRDPIIYRIKHHHHYRTGDAWCIYPMYDFAHCLEDALEGVTHSYCTLEFQDNRALYDWFIEKTEVVPPDRAPRQYEMARLELSYVITSKRRLKQLVDEGHVTGWDDPRMPTLAGLRRRGVPPEAIVSLVERVGVAKTNSVVDIALLEHAIRDELNSRAPRRMGVADPLAVTVDNWEEGELEWIDAPDFPPDVGRPGSRKVAFGRHLWIERDDFALDPEPGFKRLSPGAVVRFRHGYVAECVGVDRDADGGVREVHVRIFRDVSRGRAPKGVKVRGTIHWVERTTAVPATFALYDRLFLSPTPTRDPSGRDFLDLINPDSLVLARGFVEPALDSATPGQRFQLERSGYFVVDDAGRSDGRLLLNRTVPLKDSWS
ncbi:MAG: glutamine--tRNA ligase/YqeY domain fusion protein, partial [Deltaproteobacteria bacterium]